MIVEAIMIHALDTHMVKEEEMEIGEVFALMVEPMARSQEATVDEKVEDDFGMIDDEEYEILHMFARDNAIHVEEYIAKTESLAIYDDVVLFAPWIKSIEKNQNIFNHFGQELPQRHE